MAENFKKSLFFFLSCHLLLLVVVVMCKSTTTTKKTYIVQIDESAKPEVFLDHLHWYESLIKSVTSTQNEKMKYKNGDDEQRILYNYRTAFHGVAVQLTDEELKNLQEKHGVMAVFPETIYNLHTTRSPSFLGLDKGIAANVWSDKTLLHRDVVVGVLDTGIWPESQSFNDTGMPPIPSQWKGICETGHGFTKQHCNRKIIGARIFYRGYEAISGGINERDEHKSARDQDGHGSHTAATVAGSPVSGANLLGYANGVARGMSPGARIAVYKVCWIGGCFSSDILSAVDQAVSDGVNVLSISLGGGVSSYYKDTLSIATFGAMEKGIFISCSAGNAGPDPITLTNVSPWLATIGASTMDRDFPALVKLGNGKTLSGTSLYKGRRTLLRNKQYRIIYLGGNSSSSLTPNSLCLEGTLDRHIVAGNIVICDRGISPRVQKGQVVKDAGGIGMILSNTAANGEELVADSHLLPTIAVGEKSGKFIKNYVLSHTNTNSTATATLLFLGTKLGIRPSPIVASFSSRGPNYISLNILKPDMVAPGVNILAAWTGNTSPSSLSSDHRRTKFNILSGTSMSCPHISGIAALLKAKHQEWSPAAIKSALMTTAYVHDNTIRPLKDASTGQPSTPFDHGAGHVNPAKALDPGLIYDIEPQDYFDFLCGQGLTTSQLSVFAKFANRKCRTKSGDLNYPAISAVFSDEGNRGRRNYQNNSVEIRRTVTNVGPAVSNYGVMVTRFEGAEVRIEPRKLNFTMKNQKLSYIVRFLMKKKRKKMAGEMAPEFGQLIWKSESHVVRSPIVITWLSSSL